MAAIRRDQRRLSRMPVTGRTRRTPPVRAMASGVFPPGMPTAPISADALAAVLSADAGDCAGDLFAEVGKLLGTEACATNKVRLPLPEDYVGNALAGMRLLARVQAESARLSARLQGLVQASRMDRPRPVRSGRRLDTRRLHRVAVADERIFARKAHRIAPNTAVHLLVDLSGSMGTTVHRSDGSVTTRAGERAGVGARPGVGARWDCRCDGGRHGVSREGGTARPRDPDGQARPVTSGVRRGIHPGGARRNADGAGPVVCRRRSPRLSGGAADGGGPHRRRAG